MKKVGLIFLAIGLIISIYGGVHYLAQDKAMNFESFEMIGSTQQTLNWSPYLDIGIMIIGLIIYAAETMKSSFRP